MADDQKSYFRTTELATIPSDSGSFKAMTVKSPALSGRGDLSIYIPDEAKDLKSVPVVILLHGVYGSHWCWSLKGKAHITLQSLINSADIEPMILAMPSDGLWGDGSAYLPHHGQDFEKWIAEDVPHAVSEATGNALDAPHFIGGLSMGGFGALRIGAKYSNKFSAFCGHSSITDVSQMPLFVEEALDSYELESPAEGSVLETMLSNKKNLSPFRMDCGVDDLLIEHNRTLVNGLKSANISFEYEEHAGGHEWPYWVNHVRSTFLFFEKIRKEKGL